MPYQPTVSVEDAKTGPKQETNETTAEKSDDDMGFGILFEEESDDDDIGVGSMFDLHIG